MFFPTISTLALHSYKNIKRKKKNYWTIKWVPYVSILIHKYSRPVSPVFCGVDLLPLCNTPYGTEALDFPQHQNLICSTGLYLPKVNISSNLASVNVIGCNSGTVDATWVLREFISGTPKEKRVGGMPAQQKEDGHSESPRWHLKPQTSAHEGLLSAISRHNQQGDLPSASAPLRLCYITGPKGHQMGKDSFWNPGPLWLRLRCLDRWNTGKSSCAFATLQ